MGRQNYNGFKPSPDFIESGPCSADMAWTLFITSLDFSKPSFFGASINFDWKLKYLSLFFFFVTQWKMFRFVHAKNLRYVIKQVSFSLNCWEILQNILELQILKNNLKSWKILFENCSLKRESLIGSYYYLTATEPKDARPTSNFYIYRLTRPTRHSARVLLITTNILGAAC